MTIVERDATAADATNESYMQWGPVFAGAIGASAISFLLLTFGGAIGLSITSPWPEASAPAWAIILAVGWWSVMVQIGSLFAGGYLAGRMRAPRADATANEVQFRDGAHGFVVWAVAVVFSALLFAYAGSSALGTAAKAVSTVGAGAISSNAGAALSTAPADYAADLLLRPQPGAVVSANSNLGNNGATAADLRSEVYRIFAATIKNRELTAQDRDYLVQVVAARGGTSQDEARQRVDRAIAALQQMENDVRTAAEKARKAALIAGFVTAASLLISLAAAVGGANLGGKHRDEDTVAHLFGHRFW
jgi:hypothetical protein